MPLHNTSSEAISIRYPSKQWYIIKRINSYVTILFPVHIEGAGSQSLEESRTDSKASESIPFWMIH